MTTTLRRLTVALTGAVAIFAGTASALGVFMRGDGTYRWVTSARGETYEVATTGVYAGNARQIVAEGVGWDVFTLFVAVPLMIVAAVLVARGSYRGLLATAGSLGYFLYMYLEYSVTWAFGPLFALFAAITATSVLGLIAAGSAVAQSGVRERFDDRFPRRAWASLTIGMSVLLIVLWVMRIVDGLATEIPLLHGETTMTVQALDLGLMVPISLALAVAVLRGSPAGTVAGAAFAVTFVTMSAAIAAMMLSAWLVSGDLASSLPPIVIFSSASLAGAILATRIFLGVRSEPATPRSPTTGRHGVAAVLQPGEA
jgi:hypothetical protein